MKIFCSSSTIYFANVELYAEALKKKVGEPPASECFLCLLLVSSRAVLGHLGT